MSALGQSGHSQWLSLDTSRTSHEFRGNASQHLEFGNPDVLSPRLVEFYADARRIRDGQEALGIQLNRPSHKSVKSLF